MVVESKDLLHGSLTAKGRKWLRAEVAGWKHYVATVNGLLEPG